MKFILITLVAVVAGMLVGCSSANIEATVEARLAQERAVEATVEARLKDERASKPTATPLVVRVTVEPTATAWVVRVTTEPTPTPWVVRVTATPQPKTVFRPTPTPKRQTLRPSHPSWGSRVVYFDNAVYYLSPVSKLKAEQFREHLKDIQAIDHTTDKIYQLRKYQGETGLSYEIRNGFYKKSERSYYTSVELDDHLSTLPDDVVRLDRLRAYACELHHDLFYLTRYDGDSFTYKWVGNPNSGFEDVVLMADCDNVWAVRDGVSIKLR